MRPFANAGDFRAPVAALILAVKVRRQKVTFRDCGYRIMFLSDDFAPSRMFNGHSWEMYQLVGPRVTNESLTAPAAARGNQ